MATDNQAIFSNIASYLTQMGLGGLFTIDANGVPGGWLWQQITSGVDDQNTILINLEQTGEFKARYPIIAESRARAAAGEPVHVPTVAEVREYESSGAAVMRQAGLPAFMYDNHADLQKLMGLGLSVLEIEDRVGQTYERVQNTDPLVRAKFSEFFGIAGGDAALAAVYLDPTRTMANLERMSRSAYTAGMGQRMGLTIDQAIAERIAGTPATDAGIYQDLTSLNGLDKSGIFTETLGEVEDLSTGREGIDATFFGDGAAQKALEDRAIERKSANAAVSGGAARTNKGLIGAGTASS